MTVLPDWLEQVKQTIPEWIDKVRHKGEGYGRFRFAVDAYLPYDLYSSRFLQGTIFTVGGGPEGLPTERQKQEWVDYLLNLQREEDGLLVDERMEQYAVCEGGAATPQELEMARQPASRNGLLALVELGGKPKYFIHGGPDAHGPQEMVRYLENLHWHNPWGAASWAGLAVVYQHLNRIQGDARADEAVRAGVRWLQENQDPATGGWPRGVRGEPHRIINGIFKVWLQVIPFTEFEVRYPETIVDYCMSAVKDDPHLSGVPDPCSIYDVGLVLDTALRFTDHRRDEARDFFLDYLHSDRFLPFMRPDGAFSYSRKGEERIHGAFKLAPAKDQSDAIGTAITCQAACFAACLAGLGDELGWTPSTQWRMGL